MKCPQCGFVSFDDLRYCKKCGAQMTASRAQSGESNSAFKRKEDSSPEEGDSEKMTLRPPDFDDTIKAIKKELEEIEPGSLRGTAQRQSENQETLLATDNDLAADNDSSALLSASAVDKAAKAGFFIRMLAYSIDMTVLSLISLLLILLGYLCFTFLSISLDQNDPVQIIRLVMVAYTIISSLFEVLYFTYCHAVTGQTIGKWVCGIKVVRADGKLLGFKRAFLRWVGYVISRFLLYLGFLWVAFDAKKQGWHDKMAGSYVIRI